MCHELYMSHELWMNRGYKLRILVWLIRGEDLKAVQICHELHMSDEQCMFMSHKLCICAYFMSRFKSSANLSQTTHCESVTNYTWATSSVCSWVTNYAYAHISWVDSKAVQTCHKLHIANLSRTTHESRAVYAHELRFMTSCIFDKRRRFNSVQIWHELNIANLSRTTHESRAVSVCESRTMSSRVFDKWRRFKSGAHLLQSIYKSTNCVCVYVINYE